VELVQSGGSVLAIDTEHILDWHQGEGSKLYMQLIK